MATYGLAENQLETCPYDPAHRVKSSRYQLHIAKCRMNNLDKSKEICPFNAQHRVERGTLGYHIMNCPDRAALDKSLVASTEDTTFKGHTGVPSYSSHQPIEINENWDSEVSSRTGPGYQPRVEPPSGGIRTEFSFMKPSARKKYYEKLHSKNPGDDEESDESSTETAEDGFPELRNPTSKSYAQLLNHQKPIHELQNIGLGRGQATPSASSRIAANIFGQQAMPLRQPKSAPKIPGFQANLGMGRGNGVHVANAAPAPGEDVNQFGFGRGERR